MRFLNVAVSLFAGLPSYEAESLDTVNKQDSRIQVTVDSRFLVDVSNIDAQFEFLTRMPA